MDCKKVGDLILSLRKNKAMTQKQVADMLNISDKTISKWERGLGCPDVSLLPQLAQVLDVNVEVILTGDINENQVIGGNMKKLKLFVCPKCGNLITATGEAGITCCGNNLQALSAVKADSEHILDIQTVEDELFVTANHEMVKEHFISFVAYVTGDKVLLCKQYPEWNLQFRFHKFGRGKLYYYCTNHGLFEQNL